MKIINSIVNIANDLNFVFIFVLIIKIPPL